jgi:hypothetical protein
MEPSWLIALGIGAAVLLQVLQTIQIAIVGRKVTRTLAPPPLRIPQPLAAVCKQCGAFTHPTALRDGLCVECTPTGPQLDPPTQPRVRTRSG